MIAAAPNLQPKRVEPFLLVPEKRLYFVHGHRTRMFQVAGTKKVHTSTRENVTPETDRLQSCTTCADLSCNTGEAAGCSEGDTPTKPSTSHFNNT